MTTTVSTTVVKNVTTTKSTTLIALTTETKLETTSLPPMIDGVPISPEVNTAMALGLVILVFFLFGSALVLRSRSSKALEEANTQRRLVLELQSHLVGVSPETASSASSALKRLLELGILQPKEYMEKKMIAERLERKMSAKQLLDEGLISKEQYDALARREEGQDQN